MILNYAEMENQYVSQYKQKGLDINILRPADFENYKQFIEESGNKVTVIGNTTLKSVKGDNDNYIIIQGKKFEVTDGKMCSAKGYIPVGNNQFVRLEKTYLVGVIIAVACGIAACGVIAGLAIALPLQQSVPATTSSLLMESGSDWNGQQHLNGEEPIKLMFRRICAPPELNIRIFDPITSYLTSLYIFNAKLSLDFSLFTS